MKITILETSYSGKISSPFIKGLRNHVNVNCLIVENDLLNHFNSHGLSPVLLDVDSSCVIENKAALGRVLINLCERFKIPNFRQVYMADRTYKTKNVYAQYNYDEMIIKTINLYKAFNDYLDQEKPDFIFQHLGAELERRLFRMICDERGIPTIVFDYVPFFKGFQPAKNEYSELYNVPLRTVPKNVVEEYFNSYRDGDARYYQVIQHPSSMKEKIMRFFQDSDRYKLFIDVVSGKMNQKARLFRKKSIETGIIKKTRRKLPTDKKMIIFPLQTNEESTITVRSNGFCDQIQLIKNLALCLPDDCALVVKFHPHYLRGISISDMLKINNLQDVYLMESSLKMRDVLPTIDAVVTVNSTVGFEAIMMGKPVMLIGKSIYGGHGVTIDSMAPADWPVALKMLRDFQPPNDIVVSMVTNWLNCAFRGLYNDETETLVEDVLQFCQQYQDQILHQS